MTRFMGTISGRLDRKGRISVPSTFRAILEGFARADLVFRPSHLQASIEVWPVHAFEDMAKDLDALDTYSDEHEAMSAAIFGEAVQLRPDSDGRVILPEEFIAHASLGEAVSFIGAGKNFHIFEPEAGKAWLAEKRQMMRDGKMTLRPTPARPAE